MRRAYIALVVLLLAAALLLYVGLSGSRSGKGGGQALPPRPPVQVSGAWLSTPAHVVPVAVDWAPVDAGAEQPCIEGRLLDAHTGDGLAAEFRYTVPGDEVVRVVRSDARGAFSIGVAPISITSVTAEGFWPMEPALGFATCARGVLMQLEPRRRWTVHVEDIDGKLVTGATITARLGDEAPVTLSAAGPEGLLVVELRDGAMLMAQHPDFEPAVKLIERANFASSEVWLVMTRRSGPPSSTKLSGRVELADGTVPASAQVVIEGRGAEAGWLPLAQTSELRNGEFELVVEGQGPWRVHATRPVPGSPSVETRGEAVVLRVRPEASLSGTVTDRRGHPVTGFVVTVAEKQNLAASAVQSHNVLHAKGEWSVEHLPATTVLVSAAALGFAPCEPVEVQLSAGEQKTVNLVLDEGGTVAGVVRDRSSRAPLVGAVVSLEGDAQARLLLSTNARTDLDGGFVLPGIRPGRRSLLTAGQGHHGRLMTLQVLEGAQTTVEVLLTPVAEGDQPRLELVGIGAVLEAKGEALVVMKVLPGGGAAEAGLVPGDAITSIEGRLASNLGFAGGVELIRGEEGTTVLLSVRRADGSLVDVRVPRRVIAAP